MWGFGIKKKSESLQSTPTCIVIPAQCLYSRMSCPVFTFMACWTNKLMPHACVQQDSFTLLHARGVHDMLLFKMSLTVVNCCLCISQSWTGRSAFVEKIFYNSSLVYIFPQYDPVAFQRDTFICSRVNSKTHFCPC